MAFWQTICYNSGNYHIESLKFETIIYYHEESIFTYSNPFYFNVCCE